MLPPLLFLTCLLLWSEKLISEVFMNMKKWIHDQSWFLKREIWEHKGAVVWTPVAISAVTIVLSIAASIFALYSLSSVQIAGVKIEGSPDEHALNFVALASAIPFCIAWGFIGFFYSLGALYEDRKDKSVLFWNTLPVHHRDVVLSKFFFASVLGPTLALVGATVTAIVLMGLVSILAMIHGQSWVGLFDVSFWKGVAGLWALLPIYALWMSPVVAWCLMISAWAKSKPFLWGVGIPMLIAFCSGILFGYGGLSSMIKWVVQRLFAHISALPGLIDGSWSDVGSFLMSPSLLGGVVAALAFLAAATWFRAKSLEAL